MAAAIKKIEKRWLDNFKKCPLVTTDTMILNSTYANQLFYGRKDEMYPVSYPENFARFYKTHATNEITTSIDSLLEYLHFIGIDIQKELIIEHLSVYPDDYSKLIRKSYYILKTIAHYGEKLDVNNPYQDNNGDFFFLLRIESGESIKGGQLSIFDDVDLPFLYRKLANLPNGYENDIISQGLFSRIENSNKSIFITGKAGTGKSTFIHFFAQKTQKNVLMLGFTGIAAINVGGQTIHSFFLFPFRPLLPEDSEITKFSENSDKFKIIKKIDTIVIDEISMLRSDILEGIDYSLRINGGDPNKLFGGKQILFVGDIFQLPPVVNTSEELEKFIFSEVYKSEYFFDSISYKKLNPSYFEFNISHRQKSDLQFVNLLDKVRTCDVNMDTIEKLNERYNPEYLPRFDEFVITLTTSNAIANAENDRRLFEINYSKFVFEATITGEFKEDRYPTSKILELKKNAQIIFIKNDSVKRWVNGTIGKIDFISDDLIEIRLQDGSTHTLNKETWENRKYKYNKEEKKIVSEVIGTFTQFPIKLAWAITIHKSQGLTFDNVIIDIGTGAFVNGQVYTALSRCRTLNGITLKRKLRFEDIISDSRIINFHETERILNSIDPTSI